MRFLNHYKPLTTILDVDKYDKWRNKHLMDFEIRGTKLFISVHINYPLKNALLQWNAYILPKTKHFRNHCEPPYWIYGFRHHRKACVMEQMDSISEE